MIENISLIVPKFQTYKNIYGFRPESMTIEISWDDELLIFNVVT